MCLSFAVQLARLTRAWAFLQCPEMLRDKALTRPLDRGNARLYCLGNLLICQAFIRVEQDPRPGYGPHGSLTVASKVQKLLSLPGG